MSCTFEEGIAALLRAAKTLESSIETSSQVDRLSASEDHGYASSSPVPNRSSRKRTASHHSSSSSSLGGRSSHNQKEKYRRAGMKKNLCMLQSLLPNVTGDRQTTLHTLRRSTYYITELQKKLERREAIRRKLMLKQKSLKERLIMLQSPPQPQRDGASMAEARVLHYISESDLNSSDEEEEIDVS